MLWTICVVLLILWGLGLFTGYTMGGFLHVLLLGFGFCGRKTGPFLGCDHVISTSYLR